MGKERSQAWEGERAFWAAAAATVGAALVRLGVPCVPLIRLQSTTQSDLETAEASNWAHLPPSQQPAAPLRPCAPLL